MRRTLVVIGHGMVGHHLVERLRVRDTDDTWAVVLLAEESRPAYGRINLSSYMDGKSAEDLSLVDRDFRQDPLIDLRLSTAAADIDRQARVVSTTGGTEIRYDALVLATGSRPFVPPIPGHELDGCFVYRTIDDLARIRAFSTENRPGVVIGGGLLGVEAANALKLLGMRPHLVERAPRLMPTQIDEGGAGLLTRLIDDLGIRVHCGIAPRSIDAHDGTVCGLTLADGSIIETDLVIFSSGIRPRDELAETAGLDRAERGGIRTDDRCRTTDERIWAIGECAAVDGRCFGLVAPGYDMANVVVEQLLGQGRPRFTQPDMSTKLKLVDVDVASFGDVHGETEGALHFTQTNNVKGTYAKLVLGADARTLLGGILIGDIGAYSVIQPLLGHELPAPPDRLLHPQPSDLPFER